MGQYSELLDKFEPISLLEMDDVQLMNRTDTKFVFSSVRLPDLLGRISGNYRVLEIGGERDFSYHTTYLDTCNYLFFNQHMSDKPGRLKVRYRIYESTGTSFLEVKCKTNKNRTIKWRIKNNLEGSAPNEEAICFLNAYIHDIAGTISPILVNRFNRITLTSLEARERITIDYNLSFAGENCTDVQLPYLAVAEVKKDGYCNRSQFSTALKKMYIRESGFSKYCIGNALLRQMPRINLLKPKLLLLKKIEHEFAHSFV